ncbi:collagen alpha-2(I) chain-like [Vidua macroura]|uniref:collagen alpha-2(I) chain-like n=1 Tax=Vidua macroura TaxID=187451 RepID=UPI0023A8835E|nr:collagen alpha-2(I) chain-like [Vidua macroura]
MRAPRRREPCSSDTVPAALPGARRMAGSQEGLWGEGDEDAVPAEPRGSSGPPGAQPQPDPLVQTCLLRDLEMGPLAHTQTLRDFEQVRPRGAGTPHGTATALPALPGACGIHAGSAGRSSGVWSAGGAAGQAVVAEGAEPGRAPRSPHRPHGCGAWGPPGLGFHQPAVPAPAIPQIALGGGKKRGKGEQRGQRRELRAGREPRLCPGGAM